MRMRWREEQSLPRREGGEGEGVSVRHGGCFDDMTRRAADNTPCQAVERCSRLDTVKGGVRSRLHTVLTREILKV